MIELTYGQIWVMVGEVPEQGSLMSLRTQSIPVTVSLDLRAITREMDPFYRDILEERNKLVQKYGEDGVLKFQSQRFSEFEQEWGTMMRKKVELDIQPLAVSRLMGGQKEPDISEIDLEILAPILDFGGNENAT
jgi:hypothetical protein